MEFINFTPFWKHKNVPEDVYKKLVCQKTPSFKNTTQHSWKDLYMPSDMFVAKDYVHIYSEDAAIKRPTTPGLLRVTSMYDGYIFHPVNEPINWAEFDDIECMSPSTTTKIIYSNEPIVPNKATFLLPQKANKNVLYKVMYENRVVGVAVSGSTPMLFDKTCVGFFARNESVVGFGNWKLSMSIFRAYETHKRVINI